MGKCEERKRPSCEVQNAEVLKFLVLPPSLGVSLRVRVGLWQIIKPLVFFLYYFASSFTFSLTLSLSPIYLSDFWRISNPPTSAGHLHGLGGARRHLATLRALGQGAGARARPIHGVGGRQGGRARARQAGHARGSHCGEEESRKLSRVTESRTLADIFRLEEVAASEYVNLLSCLCGMYSAPRISEELLDYSEALCP